MNTTKKNARQTSLMNFGATVDTEMDLLALFKIREPQQIRVQDADGTAYLMWE